MQFTPYIKWIVFAMVFFTNTQVFSQLSKTHFIPPLTSAEFGNANPEEQYIYLSTPSSFDISYTIKLVGQPSSNYITGTVSNANPQEIYLGTGNGQLFIPSSQTSMVVNDRGYIIEADAPIYVSVRMKAGNSNQAGALVSKGLAGLGNTFRIGTYTNENPQTNYLNFVSVMATENNTQVTFSDLPAGLIIKNYSVTTPIAVTLNEGESYTIAINSYDSINNRDGLIGCLVKSDKPIVVNCGSANGSFYNGGGRDYGIDQIVDLSKVGTEYIFVKGDGLDGWENILIVAHSDNTSININGTATTVINAGEYYLIEGNNYSPNGNMYVETSQPVFAYQGVGATSNEANQGMFFVPPLSCETKGNLDNIATIDKIGNTNYTGGVSIVTKVGATVTINNAPISSFSTTGPNNVTGNPDYVTYKVLGLSGNVSVQCDDELYCAYFNYNGAATSGSFYSGFPTAPEINFNAQFVTLGNCIPNIKLQAANTQSFDSFTWLFDDGNGSGFTDLGSSSPEITPTTPGKYKLVGKIACTGEELESIEIPISICPDDIDNDGIIDNIDIDNDNDGILNCTESKGEVTMDLSDINAPQLVFQDNTIDNSITSALFTQNNSSGNNTANTLNGTNSGNLTSTIQPVSIGESRYDMNFTESVNIKFSEVAGISHTSVNGEYFIAQILPADKNITLVDPDDRLLVDYNFDGVFETGITQISGSEIHFKINPSPLGTTPYVFFANQVDGFSFVHKLQNTISTSTFTGALSLTCFKLDTDHDGIQDSLDLDSDNEGIPDNIENLGTSVSLSNVDADFNGLDDVYDINATPLDSDGDGIYDFNDLDSDNDGIYDLEESGSGLPDVDLDGIIDSVNSTIGINGWDDNAETSPDSDTIGYTVNDLDNDSTFSYMDLDSDNDGCSDVIEAGFSDGNNDDLLGDNTVNIDFQGLVNNASDGYTVPNSNYLTAAPIIIVTQPTDTEICELFSGSITIIPDIVDVFQWEVSTDGTTWTPIVDNSEYNGSQTAILTISNTPFAYNDYKYRVHLDRNGNSCGLYSNEVLLTVHPLPIVNSPVTLIQCDDDTDGVSLFNLTEVNDEISSNAINETFTYYESQTGALNGDTTSTDYIATPTAYKNLSSAYSQTVWSRVESQFGCASISEIQLKVGVSQIPAGAINETLSKCDDFLDINGNNTANNDDRDGIASFDFSHIKPMVEAFFLPQTPDITFYRNEADALSEENPITDTANYRNIGYPGGQQIYIRVDSQVSNDCEAFGPNITLIVEPLPIANPVTIERQCDDDFDGAYPFDVSAIESTVLGAQYSNDVNLSFFDSSGNPLNDFKGNPVTSPLPNTLLMDNQTITIRVTNNNTNDPDGPCYDETNLEFIVDVQPVANPITDQIVCDGDSGDTDDDGFYPFDTSNFTSIILGSQLGMEIYYAYIDESGNSITYSPTLPNPLVSGSQIITVEVINPINNTCAANTDINLVVNPLPVFSIDTPQIVCTSDPTFTIILDPIEDNPSEIFDYQWTYEDGTDLGQTPTLPVSTPGNYYITLTKTDGTGCSRTKEVFVNASELASITQDDLTVIDLTDNNSLTIDDSHLGQGDYEYALEDTSTTLQDEAFFSYQDDTTFNHLKGGLYKLYIRDKNGCGTTFIDVSIVGYPKFFTPNGDGDHDYWQVQGISSQFYPNTEIYIFDRYGKLLKQLNPLGFGWDGTFNGNLLPSDDYWFKALLQDGRVFMGHFALKR